MMNIPRRGEKGFTLIEILIALALLAIIGAVVIPNITGYIGRGETQAYNADKALIQSAVNGYYADPANRISGKKTYPLVGTTAQKQTGGTPTGWNGTVYSGTPTTGGFFINFTTLIGGQYINSEPASASTDNTPAGTGSYGWYVDSNGIVQSIYVGDHSSGGFQAGVYP